MRPPHRVVGKMRYFMYKVFEEYLAYAKHYEVG